LGLGEAKYAVENSLSAIHNVKTYGTVTSAGH